VSTRRDGDRVELLAAAWLLGKGYEVFMNVSANGPADLVIWDQEGAIVLVDVKSRLDSSQLSGIEPRHSAVKLLLYDEKNGFRWDRREPEF
jgi:Holliday junction resolvase-like predicted endonuclease